MKNTPKFLNMRFGNLKTNSAHFENDILYLNSDSAKIMITAKDNKLIYDYEDKNYDE